MSGRNTTEHENVRLGAYHTLELGPYRQFTINKGVWDAVDIDRIKQATDPAMGADLAVVLITVTILDESCTSYYISVLRNGRI